MVSVASCFKTVLNNFEFTGVENVDHCVFIVFCVPLRISILTAAPKIIYIRQSQLDLSQLE